MVEISSAHSNGAFVNSHIAVSSFKAKSVYNNEPDSSLQQPNTADRLCLTTNAGSFFNFNNLSFVHSRQSTLGSSSIKQDQVLASSLIPRSLNEQEAEALSNQQLKAEYGRHWQIASDSEAKKQKCLSQSIALNQSREQALHMNKLGSTLKQSGQKIGQQALVQIASGLALYASGAAMEAAGKAMLSCPFTKAVGATMISKGKALKQRGLQMRNYGQKLEVNSKKMLASGLCLGISANKQLNSIKNAWQTLNNIYRQIKTVGNLAQNSMLCAETVGRKRGLSLADALSLGKSKVGLSSKKAVDLSVSVPSKQINSKSSAVT